MPCGSSQSTSHGSRRKEGHNLFKLQRFEEGEIAEGWTNADTLGQMQQLGMAPGPERPAEASIRRASKGYWGTLTRPFAFIHRSAWKRNSTKFAVARWSAPRTLGHRGGAMRCLKVVRSAAES